MSFNTNTYTGLTADSAVRYQFDSGAIFKSWVVGTSDYATDLAAGNCIGVTKGGVTFTATPTWRQVAADGTKGKNVKETRFIDGWDIHLTGSLLRVDYTTISDALAAYTQTIPATLSNYHEQINLDENLVSGDFIASLTFIGKVTGTDDPLIIQLTNCLNVSGVSLSAVDNAEGVIPFDFTAHYTIAALGTVPCIIYTPKIYGTASGTVTDTGSPDVGATVTVTTPSFPARTTTSIAGGVWSITDIPYGTGMVITAVHAAKSGTATGVTITGGANTAVGAIAIT